MTQKALPFNVNDAGSNQTFAVLPALTSKYNVIKKLFISSGSADNYTLKWGSTTLWGPIYMAANAQTMIDLDDMRAIGPSETALNCVKGATASNVTVYGMAEAE